MNNGKFNLLDYQVPAAESIYNQIINDLNAFLIAETRTGKTYTIAAVLKRLQDQQFFANSTKLVNILWLVPKSGRIQTIRVLAAAGIKNFMVEAPSMLRSNRGADIFIDWTSTMRHGDIQYEPSWKGDEIPDIIVMDEWHMVKNWQKSQQAQIIHSAVKQGARIIGATATPGTCVGEMRIMCEALGLVHDDTDWHHFANEICRYNDPWEPNQAAMKRLNQILINSNGYIKFKDIKYLHKAKNQFARIPFRNEQDATTYAHAYEDYLKKIAELGRKGPAGIRELWVQIKMFKMTSEILRGPSLADYAVAKCKTGKQVAICAEHLETLRKAWSTLVHEHHVDKDRIIFIIGDQSEENRQKAADKWQNGDADYLLLSKAGGISISLHHDIENGRNRPREVILSPIWSAIEFVQWIGRFHGPTSKSTTIQTTLWYAGTIEDKVASRLEQRKDSLKEMVTKRETWADLFNKESQLTAEDVELNKIINEEMDETKDEDGESISFNVDLLE